MSFTPTTILSTREYALGGRWLGQVVAIPTGRLDKVSLYLEAEVSDQAIADLASVIVEVYALDGSLLPTGSPIASDSKALSEIKIREFVNFRLEADVPTSVGVVLRMVGGDQDNLVTWRYQPAPTSADGLLISGDDGLTWSGPDPNRKFSYVAFSGIPDVVDVDDQSAKVQAGTAASVVDDTAAEWNEAELDRAVVIGDTVAINFGNFVITLVVDQSGSMTWNDNAGLRFDFLKQYINDIESILPPGSTATYSLIKFRSRKIASMNILLQSGQSAGADLAGAKIVRKTTGYPTTASDGIKVYEGLAETAADYNLTPGTTYYYSAFTFDASGNFSERRIDFAQPTTPITAPMGVAALSLRETVILSGDYDIGIRQVAVSWANPQGYDYNSVTLIRRDDRPADSPDDFDGVHGFQLVNAAPATTSYLDFPAIPDPVNGAINGHTYYYRIFTKNAGVKCLTPNARSSSITISLVDRIWEKAEPPGNVPPVGFVSTPPAAPTNLVVTDGQGELKIEWQSGDSNTRRFLIWHGDAAYPQGLTPENGAQGYQGEVVFEGTGESFVHRHLDNGQPNFYILAARDQVNNQSSVLQFTATPRSDAPDTIAPAPVSDFMVEIQNSTTNMISWKLPVSRQPSATAWFGDTATLTASVAFADNEIGGVSATFMFVEDSRSIVLYDTQQDVDQASAINIAAAPSLDASSITSVLTVTPLIEPLNRMRSASINMHASLRAIKKNTGEVIQEVVTNPVSVTFNNPFDLSISNDPPQLVSRRTWKADCSAEASPGYSEESIPGVYANSGDSFHATLEASYRDAALTEDIFLSIRILDSDTGLPSPTLKLPETSADGIAIIRTQPQTDETLDRSGQPTGETIQKSVVDISLPPQSAPGDYILEVTGSYLGYSRTTTLDVHYEPALNIDLDAAVFQPDGSDIAEQKALVYYGAYNAPLEKKVPVADLTVVDWGLRLLGGNNKGKSRPFFSRDTVPGTGIKSYTHAGVARNVFFGPGTDVEPAAGATCTEGELYEISAKVKVNGQIATAFATVELSPFNPTAMDRIFMRLVSGGFASTTIYADGEAEAVYEVIAKPENDGLITDQASGKYFRDTVVGLGGRVPSLEDGRIVTMYVRRFSGNVDVKNVVIKTNLTPTAGASGLAKAKIESGKAIFRLSLNAKVAGRVRESPLDSEFSNPVYQGGDILWQESPIIMSPVVFVTLEVNGRPAVFSGGGSSIQDGTPPAFVSFAEPLGA